MNNISKFFGATVLGLVTSVAGCGTPSLSRVDGKLTKYDADSNEWINSKEATVLIENEFDAKPKDGKLSLEELDDSLNFAGRIPNVSENQYYTHDNLRSSRQSLLDAAMRLRLYMKPLEPTKE